MVDGPWWFLGYTHINKRTKTVFECVAYRCVDKSPTGDDDGDYYSTSPEVREADKEEEEHINLNGKFIISGLSYLSIYLY